MRRKDKQVSDPGELEEIIKSAHYVVVGFQTGAEPYMVPLDFVFDGTYVYFHCAKDGRKLDLLRAQPEVALLFVDYGGIFGGGKDNTACNYSTKYRSVMARGKALVLEDFEDKKMALSVFMTKFELGHLPFKEKMIDATCVVRVELIELVGKQSPVKPKQ